jgi:hypothetical protein
VIQSIKWPMALAASAVLALAACDVTPAKYDDTPPVLRLTIHDNATQQNTVAPVNSPTTPFQLPAGYDLMLTVAAVDADGGMGELTVNVSHYKVSCSVKPNGPKAPTLESYSIDNFDQKAVKQADGKVPTQLNYIKFFKAPVLDNRYCAVLHQDGKDYYPTVDPGGIVEVYATAKNAAVTQGAVAHWYLKRPG